MTKLAAISIVALLVSACANNPPNGPRGVQFSPTAAPVPAAATTQPILYHRTGGIAGTNDRLVIWPDGFVQIDGKLFTPAVTRLPPERLDQIESMFRGWESLKSEYLSNNIPDAYTITIHYGDKAVTASDLAPDLPQTFRDIFTELEAVAFEAQQQQDPVKPPPAAP
jgi:hypothetical protein